MRHDRSIRASVPGSRLRAPRRRTMLFCPSASAGLKVASLPSFLLTPPEPPGGARRADCQQVACVSTDKREPPMESVPDLTSSTNAARCLYLDLLEKIVCNTIYEDDPDDFFSGPSFDLGKRTKGRDWPSKAHSMVGLERIRNTRLLAEEAIKRGLKGSFLEAGVWRGGASIVLRGGVAAYSDPRSVICADSFAGLPPPNPSLYPDDVGMNLHVHQQLRVSLEQVRQNFAKYGLLDDQVVFLEGLFSDTLPTISGTPFALIRLDGDMYESTYGALDNLYPSLVEGGFVIIDDFWDFKACRSAVTDYINKHGLRVEFQDIDGAGIWWSKS